MFSDRLGGWLQVGANLGIIAGLILVAYQINQTADITSDRIYFDRWSAWMDTSNVLLGESPAEILAKADTHPEDLTPGEIVALQTYFGVRLDYWRRIKALGERGIIEKDDWRAAIDRAHPEFSSGLLGQLSTPAGRAYWDYRRRVMRDDELVEAIDTALADEPILDYRRFEDFRVAIQTYKQSAFASDVEIQAAQSGRYFSSAGVRIHYVDHGQGEPVVLMHGLNDDLGSAWFDTNVAQALVDGGYRVLALDGRAHGLSGTPHGPAQYGQEMSLDISRLLQQLGIDRAHIVGYSMGARIVGKLREVQPEVVATLTLGGFGWTKHSGPSTALAALADSLERGEGFMPLYRELYPDWTDEERETRSAAMLGKLPDVTATVAMLRGYDFGVSEESLRAKHYPNLGISWRERSEEI